VTLSFRPSRILGRIVGAVALVMLTFGLIPALLAQTPEVGAKAPGFTLNTPLGKSVSLASEVGKGQLVLVLLRGYPGYQCPYCQKQVHDFVEHANSFATEGVRVLLVYPGPPTELDTRAKEFLAKQAELPANITLVTDPNYTMTNLYGLRWQGEHETAYPSTFILDKAGVIRFEKISHAHGGRTTAEEVLMHLSK
jgi:peroxiredoxin Q/BCP